MNMTPEFYTNLIALARKYISNDDPSHDFYHALRVSRLSSYLSDKEGADPEISIPAALFHDVVVYPKNHTKRHQSSNDSAEKTREILTNVDLIDKSKIFPICEAIACCSFSKALIPASLEAKILQDADALEATGAIAIMRTFSSAGQMSRTFYHEADPFCEDRSPDDTKYALDLFVTRLLKIETRLHTETAKKLAHKRRLFLLEFLKELRLEIFLYE